VYQISPDGLGGVGASSRVERVVGNGNGVAISRKGTRQPATFVSLNQPVRLSMSEDGVLFIQAPYGAFFAYDTLSRDLTLLFEDRGQDEIQEDLSPNVAPIPGQPSCDLLAITGNALLAIGNGRLVRVDIERMSSLWEPTRTLARVPGGEVVLTDTTAARTWRYDRAGRLVEQKKRTGEREFLVEYVDGSGDKILRIVDAAGGEIVFLYDGDKIRAIRDQRGRETTLTVNAQGDLESVRMTSGETYAYTYNAHRRSTKSSPRGDLTSYAYREDGTLASTTKPAGEVQTFTQAWGSGPVRVNGSTLRREARHVDAHGVMHTMVLNDRGEVESDSYVADGIPRVERAVYAGALADRFAVVSRKNTIFRVERTELNGVPLDESRDFDALGRVWRRRRLVSGAGGEAWRGTYDANGWLKQVFEGPSSVAQHIERDAAGHVTRIFDAAPDTGLFPTGRQQLLTWRPDGQPATITEHGVTTTYTYDDAGGTLNLLATVDTLGRTSAFTYDLAGNVTSASDGTASASFVYDTQNRLTEARDAEGNATTLRYSHAGCGCTEQDLVTGIHTPDLPSGVEWSFDYGAEGRLEKVTDPHGFEETYAYETTGELKTIVDRLSRTTSSTHDQLGRVVSMVDTLGRRHTRSYPVPTAGTWSGPGLVGASGDATAASTSLSGTLRAGDYQIGHNAFDIEGHPALISLYRDATFDLSFAHQFDTASRLVRRTSRDGRPSSDPESSPSALPVGKANEQHGWNALTAAPLLATSFSTASTAENQSSVVPRDAELDALGTEGFSGGLDSAARYTYTRDVGGRVTGVARRYANGALFIPGTPSPVAGPTSAYTYRPDGRVGRAEGPDGAHDFTYDARGLLATRAVDGEGTYAYAYDELGRNTRLTYPDGHARVQTYDDLGRITSRCYDYSALGADTRCYTAAYDPVGNPVRMTDPEGTDVLTYDA
ncbi:MAG: RHS repeat protein, partial [Myxococcales bacterium]|nr:RHS repeat protein [Myxococcales bacterium]